jgi:hypothetical protein
MSAASLMVSLGRNHTLVRDNKRTKKIKKGSEDLLDLVSHIYVPCDAVQHKRCIRQGRPFKQQ